MKLFWKLFLVFCITILLSYIFFRNHIRQQICANFSVSQSSLTLEEEYNEGIFNVEIYNTHRTFKNKWIARYNYFFDDELMVVYLPIDRFKFRNLVLKPMGNDNFSEEAVFRFNTLFFDEDFNATTGIIDDDELVSDVSPKRNRLAITEEGELVNSAELRNSRFNDVLQAPHTYSILNSAKGFRSLHYRQFIAIQNGQLIFIAGNGNSLISWRDVQSLMKIKGIDKVIALDGGASVDYFFKGEKHCYNFSSIPFRRFWFKLNSPYYLEAELKQ